MGFWWAGSLHAYLPSGRHIDLVWHNSASLVESLSLLLKRVKLREKIGTSFSTRTTTEDDRDPLSLPPSRPLLRISIFTLRVAAAQSSSTEHNPATPPPPRAPHARPSIASSPCPPRRAPPPAANPSRRRPTPIDPSTPFSLVPTTRAPPANPSHRHAPRPPTPAAAAVYLARGSAPRPPADPSRGRWGTVPGLARTPTATTGAQTGLAAPPISPGPSCHVIVHYLAAVNHAIIVATSAIEGDTIEPTPPTPPRH
jgi:hypothetical protein